MPPGRIITLTGDITTSATGPFTNTVDIATSTPDGDSGNDHSGAPITANAAPTADAGDNQIVNPGATATLDGSGSSDPVQKQLITIAYTHNI